MSIRLQQNSNLPAAKDFDRLSHAIIVLPAKPTDKDWQVLPYGDVLKQRYERAADNGQGEEVLLVTDLPNDNGTRVSLALIKSEASTFELLGRARKLISPLLEQDPTTIAVLVQGVEAALAERMAEALLAAALAAVAELPNFKSKPVDTKKLDTFKLYGFRAGHAFRRTFATAAGNTLTRRLSMMPSNKLTPTEYLAEIRKLARQHGWKLDFYGVTELRKRKAGAFLAVAQGSDKADAGIVRLRYMPKKKSKKKPLFLVGKGICYDTGGTNLKPHRAMFGMHEDMQGSALALGTLLALTELQVDYPIEAWLALAMNHIGPKAYKPNDVVVASDGTSIEIVHTDAEGRMVLADTLIQASNEKPRLIIDYATLTGTCVMALGSGYCGVFTNRDEWNSILIEAGRASGERVWPFPMDSDYEKGLESTIADTKQCAMEGNADHIVGARFLQNFVKHDTPWIHVDLSAMNRKGGLAHIPTDTVGFGVRFSLNLLMDQKLI